MLLDAGADPAVSTAKGFTPLMLAAQNGDIETARALRERDEQERPWVYRSGDPQP